MKILHLIYTSGPFGAEKHLLQLLPELKKRNIFCEVIFICPKRSISSFKDYCQQMSNFGIKITLLPITSKISLFTSAHKIYRYLKSNQIQVIHSHLFSADLIAVIIKKIYFPHLVILSTKHGYEEKYLLQYGLGNKKIRYNFYYFISRVINKRIDHNLAVSKTLSQLYSYLKLGNVNMKYINHGILPKVSSSQKLQLEGDPKIMIVGRLSEIKGHKYLLNAMPEVILKFPKIKLYILGEGPLKQQLHSKAKNLNILNNIEFAGFANPSDYTQECQVMILPSLFESFGLVFIESFALKIPVITFDTEAGNQIIENNETGLLVEKENVGALAKKIIYLLESPEIRARIVEKAYYKYLAYYTLEKMSNETADWYKVVLKQTTREFKKYPK